MEISINNLEKKRKEQFPIVFYSDIVIYSQNSNMNYRFTFFSLKLYLKLVTDFLIEKKGYKRYPNNTKVWLSKEDTYCIISKDYKPETNLSILFTFFLTSNQYNKYWDNLEFHHLLLDEFLRNNHFKNMLHFKIITDNNEEDTHEITKALKNSHKRNISYPPNVNTLSKRLNNKKIIKDYFYFLTGSYEECESINSSITLFYSLTTYVSSTHKCNR